MHLSIVCPTSPCMGIGVAKGGVDYVVYFNPTLWGYTEGSIPHFRRGSQAGIWWDLTFFCRYFQHQLPHPLGVFSKSNPLYSPTSLPVQGVVGHTIDRCINVWYMYVLRPKGWGWGMEGCSKMYVHPYFWFRDDHQCSHQQNSRLSLPARYDVTSGTCDLCMWETG